jgi:hypothetical protein
MTIHPEMINWGFIGEIYLWGYISSLLIVMGHEIVVWYCGKSIVLNDILWTFLVPLISWIYIFIWMFAILDCEWSMYKNTVIFKGRKIKRKDVE